MARKKFKGKNAAFMMFNVTYEDGTITSNYVFDQVTTVSVDGAGGADTLVGPNEAAAWSVTSGETSMPLWLTSMTR